MCLPAPPPPPRRCLLAPADVKKFKKRVNTEALSALAELFMINGDLSAWLYTGSQVGGRGGG